LKTIGFQFDPYLLKFGYESEPISINVEGAYWISLNKLFPQRAAEIPFEDDILQNQNWQAGIEVYFNKPHLMLEVGGRGDPFGDGVYFRMGYDF